MFWMSRQELSSYRDRKYLLLVTIIAAIVSIAGAVVDSGQLVYNTRMTWCRSGGGATYMTDGSKYVGNTASAGNDTIITDSENLRGVNQCVAADTAKHQENIPGDVMCAFVLMMLHLSYVCRKSDLRLRNVLL